MCVNLKSRCLVERGRDTSTTMVHRELYTRTQNHTDHSSLSDRSLVCLSKSRERLPLRNLGEFCVHMYFTLTLCSLESAEVGLPPRQRHTARHSAPHAPAYGPGL